MLYSIKPQPAEFNLLYLNDGESLVNSINSYYFNISNKSVEESIIHLNTRSIIIRPKEITKPLLKLGLSDNLCMKIFTFEDVLNMNYILQEAALNPNTNHTSNNNINNIVNNNSNLAKESSKKEINLSKNNISRRQSTTVNNINSQNFVQLYNDMSQGTLNHTAQNSIKNLGKKISLLNQLNNVNRICSKDSRELKEVNYSSRYVENINHSIKKISNKNHTNSNIPKYFDLKITNLSSMLERAFTENTGIINNNNNINMNNNMTNFFSAKSNSMNNSNNINLNVSIQNSQNNTNKRPSSGNTSNIIGIFDLLAYFQDNFLNINKLCDIINIIQNTYSRDNKISNKHYILLIKSNRSHSINRKPLSSYEVNLQSQTHFLIIEGEDSKCEAFFNDMKFVTETLFKSPTEDKEYETYVNKKISDLSDNIETIKKQISTINSAKNRINEETNILFKSKVIRLLPEGIQHGLLLIVHQSILGVNKLDNIYIEFIPITNDYKMKSCSFKLNKIQSIVTYRYLYKNSGLNIFLYQSKRSKIFIFDDNKDHKFVMEYLNDNSQNINKHFTDIDYHTELWSNGLMSNFEYLMYLNTMSSRSFNDLSQYPVFPWVITNYEDTEDFDITEDKNYRDLSKPIGALNVEKFEKFNKKYLEMKLNSSHNEPPYYYGKHYSTPAYVIYYLTRAFPQLQLQIQGGSFGPSERMFNSVKDCWEYLYSDLIRSEVMELIPEFYKSDGEFLLNIHNSSFEKNKNSGKPMNEVVLPKWAKSAGDFINICKSALESEYVSSNINHWIDLIFGYKQRGEAAEANDNLFYHVTYDNYNYDDFPEDKKFAINQILQFGQTPRQLFIEPHPKKRGIDMLNYEIITNPKDLSGAIDKYKRENEKLENTYKKMIDAKFMDKQKLIGIYRDIDKKKNEKINKLKEESKIQEDSYREIIEKMIEHSNILKEKFKTYDLSKDRIYNDSINKMVEDHENDKINKYSNQINLSDHVKNLEISINQSKLIQSESIENLHMLQYQLDKQNKINESLRNQILLLQNKLDVIADFTEI